MCMRVKKIFFFILFAAAYTANGQGTKPAHDTLLKGGNTIEVLQKYKPQVKQAPKPEWMPGLPPADTSHAAMSYDVPQQTLYYTYSSLPLRPLALGKDVTPLPFANYVKAGGGNLSTLFLDAGIGGIKGENYESAIHLHHLSQKGAIKYQQSSQSGLEADAVLHREYNDWHAALSGERNQYYYYGYNHSLYDFVSDDVKQAYTAIRASVDMQNKLDSDDHMYYHPAINLTSYNARFNTSEITLGLNAPVTYNIDSSLDAYVALSGAFTNYKSDTYSTNNNFIEVLPGMKYHKGRISGHLLLGLALGKGSTGYFLPDVMAGYRLPGDRFIVSAGWQSTLRQNTYEQMTMENPYMTSSYWVLQTRRREAFVNVLGSTGDHLSFSGRVSMWSYNDLPTFLNDTGDQKRLYVHYLDVNAVSFHIAARYAMANEWSAGLSADIFSFSGSTQKVWHQPTMKIKGDFAINPTPKLTVTAYLALLGGMQARDLAGNTVTLKMNTDIGCNAEYRFIKRLSAFVQVDNILNQKYQRWYGYQSYGINIYGGLRLKF